MLPWLAHRHKTLVSKPLPRVARRMLHGPSPLDAKARARLRALVLGAGGQPSVFVDEVAARDWVRKLRWPGGFRCERCQGRAWAAVPDRPRLLRCTSCHHQHSVTAGTPLHGLRTPLCRVLYLLVLLGSCRFSTNAAARRAGMRYHTVWHIWQKLRGSLGQGAIRLGEHVAVDAFLVSRRGTSLEPNPPHPHTGERERVAVACLIDEQLNLRTRSDTLPGTNLERHLRETIGRTLEETPRVGWNKPRPLVQLIEMLQKKHRSVSRRWLDRYLDALCVMQWLQREPGELLAMVLAGPRRTARQVAPPWHPPAHRWLIYPWADPKPSYWPPLPSGDPAR